MSRRIETSAPGRANLIGNPSDQYGGCTLACSVPLRARVELDASIPGEIHSAGEVARIGSEAEWAPVGDSLDLGRAALAVSGLAEPPFGIRYESEIPRQSGMAGSTALLVALTHAIDIWFGRPRDPSDLAEKARDTERSGLGVQCGFVDQYACVYGGLHHVDLRGKSFEDDPDAPFATVEDLGGRGAQLPFVLAYTGVRHSSDSVHRPLRERWQSGELEVVEAYARVAEIGVQGKSAFQRGAWQRLGELMNENHRIQRDLGGSGESNERLIHAALEGGALGAKLAGAGDGGTIVALAPPPSMASVEAALESAGAAMLVRPGIEAGVRCDLDSSRART